jgi:C1A family cysteine protease
MMIYHITKFILSFLILISITCLSFALSSEYSISSHGKLDKFSSDEEVFELFQLWKKEHGRDYANSEEENAKRFEIFKTNFKYINEMNAKRKSQTQHSLSLNKFADMSPEEFSKTYLPKIEMQIPSNRDNAKLRDDDDCENLPTSVDWREKGAVTEVRDQGNCRKILY